MTVLPEGFSWSDFVEASRRFRRPCLRVNPLKATVDTVRRLGAVHGWHLEEPVPWTEGAAAAAGSGFWVNPGSAVPREEIPRLEELPSSWGGSTTDAALGGGEESQTVPWSRDASHFAGHVYVQEAASMLPVAALVDAFPGGPPDGVKIFDASAAPGGKTTALVAWAAPARGGVLANDSSTQRSKALVSNLLRTGAMPWAAVSQVDAAFAGKFWPEAFDAALVDAPCSGGEVRVGRANRFALRDCTDKEIGRLSNLQRMMLVSAVHALKVGGVVVYSTCTLNPIENEEVVAFVEGKFGDAVERMPLERLAGTEAMITEEGHLRCWPHVSDSQGFFVARLRKVKPTVLDGRLARTTSQKPGMRVNKKYCGRKYRQKGTTARSYSGGDGSGTIGAGLDRVNRKDAKPIGLFFADAFEWELPLDAGGLALRRKGGEVWLGPEALHDLRSAGVKRCGIRLADTLHKTIKGKPCMANFEWVLSFAHRLPGAAGCAFDPAEREPSRGAVELGVEAARAFCRGERAEPEWGAGAALALEDEQVVVRHGGLVLGLGRWQAGAVHNETPPIWRCEEIVL